MNLKYYLRGLGIGIVVTAIIMGIASGGKKEELSNEEIKERARALGMTEESTVLADAAGNLQAELQKGQEETQEEEPSMTPEAVSTPSAAVGAPSLTPAAGSEPSKTPMPSAAKDPAAPTAKPAEADGDSQNMGTATIQVDRGDGSLTVSRKLEQAGLVSSAADFDLYLCQNGYDKRLNVGTYEIPADADNEQIAKILARLE